MLTTGQLGTGSGHFVQGGQYQVSDLQRVQTATGWAQVGLWDKVVGTFELTQIIAPQWVLPFGEDTIRCHICARREVGKIQWVFVNTVGHFPFISCGG